VTCDKTDGPCRATIALMAWQHWSKPLERATVLLESLQHRKRQVFEYLRCATSSACNYLPGRPHSPGGSGGKDMTSQRLSPKSTITSPTFAQAHCSSPTSMPCNTLGTDTFSSKQMENNTPILLLAKQYSLDPAGRTMGTLTLSVQVDVEIGVTQRSMPFTGCT